MIFRPLPQWRVIGTFICPVIKNICASFETKFVFSIFQTTSHHERDNLRHPDEGEERKVVEIRKFVSSHKIMTTARQLKA